MRTVKQIIADAEKEISMVLDKPVRLSIDDKIFSPEVYTTWSKICKALDVDEYEALLMNKKENYSEARQFGVLYLKEDCKLNNYRISVFFNRSPNLIDNSLKTIKGLIDIKDDKILLKRFLIEKELNNSI